jgi:hypothetical protein
MNCMPASDADPRSAPPFFLWRYALPRLGDALFIALWLGIVATGSRLLNADGDLGRHLTVGQSILDTLQIPARDIFSHTMAGQPFTPHEWLAEVIFAVSYRWLGLNGVVVLCALVLSLAVVLAYRQARTRSGLIFPALMFTLLAAVAGSIHWIARPHLWTMLLVVVWIGGMERLRRGQYAYWWILPVVMCVWANLHGAFIVGFVIWLMYAAGLLWEKWSSSEKSASFPLADAYGGAWAVYL